MTLSQLNKNTLLTAKQEVTLILSLLVVLIVFWCLKLTGITMAGEAFCGMDEHVHGDTCPAGRLICQLEESDGHTHDESCLVQQLLCELEEIEAHTHSDDCLNRQLICTESEREGHFHNDSCRGKTLICQQEELEGHAHGDTCFASNLICGSGEDPEHQHFTDCYETVLTCTAAEVIGHAHGDECYVLDESGYICNLEEIDTHFHTAECYVLLDETYICALEETAGHTHSEECYCISEEYGCGETEAEAHTHTDDCYEITGECPLEEHVHTENCYSDITADLETRKQWEESLANFTEGFTTGDTLVSIARTQLGYTESTLNFEVDLHGVRRGITRYGQWYGNPYGDWSAMFVSFCLHYTGVADFPANAGPESMRLEWETIELYIPAEGNAPTVGNLLFLRAEEIPADNETETADALPTTDPNTAVAVAIISAVTEDSITMIRGDWEDSVAEITIPLDDPTILGYGMVPNHSTFALRAAATAEAGKFIARKIDLTNNLTSIFTTDRRFVIYAVYAGQNYALISRPASGIEATVEAVPITIDDNGNIYADVDDPNSLLWSFTRSNNNYIIKNAATGRYLHSGGDPGVIYDRDWPMTVSRSGVGARLTHTSNNNALSFNSSTKRFEITTNKNNAPVLYFGVSETVTVWLDGTDGGLTSLTGSQNQSYSVSAGAQMTLPSQWLSPTKYHYALRGWYDVTHAKYYAPGETVTITENTVFYADWMASTYDIGQYNALVADTVSTNGFITTQLFDYNYLFNVLSADPEDSVSSSGHSENWSIDQSETVEFEGRETLNFIFLDYHTDSGSLEYPNNRLDGVNQYPGEGIVTGGIYNNDIGNALFSTAETLPGKVYLGTADHLFQIMDDPNDEFYGYYYYDSSLNAASYNQSAGRFYVYDYLEATSAELSATKSDFLPLNSPYANTNGQNLNTYVPDGEHAQYTNYVYDAKYDDSSSSANRVGTNYAFGMKMDINFYLPNQPGERDANNELGNQDVYGNDMRFYFSGDDDLWVLVDGKLALDIGGIHQAETGEINFSTGEVKVQGVVNNALTNVVSSLEPGEHVLTVMYLERGASHSNCAIYFNLAPRYHLSIQKEDVLTRDVLNGAQFSVYHDLACTQPVDLWVSEAEYLNGVPATNTFTVENGTATMWGMGAGNTYYIKETRAPDKSGYGFPNGVIRMILDKKGAATYSVIILDGGDGISGGFTVHGFRVDEETQQAYIIATNAPEWVEDVTSVEARKVWNDTKNHNSDSITVYLTVQDQDGTVRRLQEATLNAETNWAHLWENLPKKWDDGTLIQYGVEEAYIPGYYGTVEQVEDYNISTQQWVAASSLENGKTYLLKTKDGYLSTLNANSDTGYKWVTETEAASSTLAQWKVTKDRESYKFTNLAGQTITFYYGNGSPTDFYAYNQSVNNNNSKQSFSVSWTNGQFRFYFKNGNTSYYPTLPLNGSSKFPNTTSSGSAVLFTPMIFSNTSANTPAEGDIAYKITNTPLTEETALTVYKEWYIHTGDDPTLYEQAQVTVKLLANGKDTGRTVTLTLKNGWTDAFRGLPYKDDNGEVIIYTVEEVWSHKDWLVRYGPINTSGSKTPTYDTTVTNEYRWGHGVELPSTGTAARLIFVLCGASIMVLPTVIYGFVSRRKRERRMK